LLLIWSKLLQVTIGVKKVLKSYNDLKASKSFNDLKTLESLNDSKALKTKRFQELSLLVILTT
jgi:hypothetical protein